MLAIHAYSCTCMHMGCIRLAHEEQDRGRIGRGRAKVTERGGRGKTTERGGCEQKLILVRDKKTESESARWHGLLRHALAHTLIYFLALLSLDPAPPQPGLAQSVLTLR